MSVYWYDLQLALVHEDASAGRLRWREVDALYDAQHITIVTWDKARVA